MYIYRLYSRVDNLCVDFDLKFLHSAFQFAAVFFIDAHLIIKASLYIYICILCIFSHTVK